MARRKSYDQSVPFLFVRSRDNALLKEFNEIQAEIEKNGESKTDPEGFERLYEKVMQINRKK